MCVALLRAVDVALHGSKSCEDRRKGLLGRRTVGSHVRGSGCERRGVGEGVTVVWTSRWGGLRGAAT